MTSPLAIARLIEHEMRHEGRLDSNQLLTVLQAVLSPETCCSGSPGQRADQVMGDIADILQQSTLTDPEDTSWFQPDNLTKQLPLVIERCLHLSSAPVFDKNSKQAGVAFHKSETYGLRVCFPVHPQFKLPLLYSWKEQDQQSLISVSVRVPVAGLDKRLHLLYAIADPGAELVVQFDVWRLQQALWCTLSHSVVAADLSTEWIDSGGDNRSFPCTGIERCIERLTSRLA